MPFFDDFFERGQAARKNALKAAFGLEPFEYDSVASEDAYGLFQAYDASDFHSFVADAGTQIIARPFAVFHTALGLTMISLGSSVLYLVKALAVAVDYATLEEDEDHPLYNVLFELSGSFYFAVHTVLDTLWEVMAAVTRTLTSACMLLIGGASAVLSCCFSDDDDQVKASITGSRSSILR